MRDRTRQAWIMVLGMAVAALVVALIFAVFTSAAKSTEVRSAQVTNTKTLDSSAQALRIIRNCTTPGRKCYERSLRQTAHAVADINRVVIAAASCASEPYAQTVEQIQACVVARLADR